MEIIDTRIYHSFIIDEIYFKGNFIFTRVNETRMTCSDLLKREYKQMRKISFPCVIIHPIDIISICLVLLHLFITCILSMNYIGWKITKTRFPLQKLFYKRGNGLVG